MTPKTESKVRTVDCELCLEGCCTADFECLFAKGEGITKQCYASDKDLITEEEYNAFERGRASEREWCVKALEKYGNEYFCEEGYEMDLTEFRKAIDIIKELK